MRNWADHCSSDDEDDALERQQQMLDHEGGEKDEHAEGDRHSQEDHHEEAPKRTYDFPTEPPYTAFVGNLAYSIIEPEALSSELSKVVKARLGMEMNIFNARILMDRHSETPRHRGFGYVQVETLDDLKALMDLNERGATLAGRKIQLDTANTDNNRQRRSSSSNVDGSKFRGGRFSKRQSRSNGSAQQEQGGTPAQRPSLKLQPRSKPVEDSSVSGSASNIFGSGRARDEQEYERRQSDKVTPKGEEHGDQKRRNSRRGSKNNGSQRRSSGRGGEDGTGKSTGARAKTEPKEDKKVVVPKAEPEKPKTTNKVTNTFAALAFDSDSE